MDFLSGAAQTNRSIPAATVIPVLAYDDVQQAVDWLCKTFGFVERLRIGDHRAQLSVGAGAVIVSERRKGPETNTANDATVAEALQLAEASHSVHVRVVDAEQHYRRVQASGAHILQPPTDYPYGERQYVVKDPGGHRWTFTQSIADVDPAEWGGVLLEHEEPSSSDDMERLAQLPRPRLCYLEIPALDVRQSALFYEKVFGWKLRKRESERPSFDDATGNISGTWVTGRAIVREPGLLPYIWVDSIDATLEQVKLHGGQIISPAALDEPGGEWIATFRDPAGNAIGLYQEGAR